MRFLELLFVVCCWLLVVGCGCGCCCCCCCCFRGACYCGMSNLALVCELTFFSSPACCG